MGDLFAEIGLTVKELHLVGDVAPRALAGLSQLARLLVTADDPIQYAQSLAATQLPELKEVHIRTEDGGKILGGIHGSWEEMEEHSSMRLYKLQGAWNVLRVQKIFDSRTLFQKAVGEVMPDITV